MTNIILWDWDNTLIDSFEAILLAQNELRTHYNLPLLTKEEAKLTMNASSRNLLKDLVGENKVQEARTYFLKAYTKHAATLQLKDGATEILSFCQNNGYINILASNKQGNILRNEVKALNLTHYFDRIIGAEDAINDKPSKEFTDTALQGYNYQRIIAVGDGKSDIKIAHNYPNGIGVLVWTNPNSEEFDTDKPNFSIPDLISLKQILNR